MKWTEKGDLPKKGNQAKKMHESTFESYATKSKRSFADMDTRGISLYSEKYARRWQFIARFGVVSSIMAILMTSTVTGQAQAETGLATWYTTASTKAEGNSGIMASGKPLNEKAMTCAMRTHEFGKLWKIRNTSNGKSIILPNTDFGPGKGPKSRGVIVDLTPAAYDALGGKRGVRNGIPYGEMKVEVSEVPGGVRS